MPGRRVSKQARGTATVILGVVIAVLLIGVIAAAVALFRMISGDFGGGATGSAIEVPDVLGMKEEEARAALGQSGFSAKIVLSDYNDKYAAGQVFQQNPQAGMRIKKREVRLCLSLGPAHFVTPDLIGEHIDNAPKKLAQNGFVLGGVQRVYSKQFAAGRIISQNPKKGQEFNATEVPVDVVVADSTNLPKLAMPELYGQSLDAVSALLASKEVNLRLGLVVYVSDDVNPAGTVVRQEPAAGKEVTLGAKVSVDVAAPTVFMETQQRTVQLRIPVPNGPDEQQVKIKQFDKLGEQVVLDEKHHPGEIIERSLDLDGQAKILIFIGDMKNPLREDRL